MRLTLPLAGVTNGQTVNWSVQTVDTAFAGGLFAAETSVVSLPLLSISISPQPFVAAAHVGLVVQETTNANSGLWNNAPSGDANPATVSATNSATFYRLFRP